MCVTIAGIISKDTLEFRKQQIVPSHMLNTGFVLDLFINLGSLGGYE
jgi:hypothetical protein